jgi:F-type H+-transporting ATPase subunit delta
MTDIGKEYGTALFMLAREKNAEEKYFKALELLKTSFEDEPEYTEFLASPSISLGERISAIERAFENRVPEDVLSYLCLLCEKGRIPDFKDSFEQYSLLLDAFRRIANAVVISAVELVESEKNALAEKLEKMCGASVNIEYRIDPSIIGGVIVEMDGKTIDGSLRSRLSSVKDVIRT